MFFLFSFHTIVWESARDRAIGVIHSRSYNQWVCNWDAVTPAPLGLHIIYLSFHPPCLIPHPCHPRCGNRGKYNSQNKTHGLFIHSISRPEMMSSCYITGSREVSERKCVKKTHSRVPSLKIHEGQRKGQCKNNNSSRCSLYEFGRHPIALGISPL